MIINPTGYFIQRPFAEMKSISQAIVTTCLCLLQNLIVEEERTISPPTPKTNETQSSSVSSLSSVSSSVLSPISSSALATISSDVPGALASNLTLELLSIMSSPCVSSNKNVNDLSTISSVCDDNFKMNSGSDSLPPLFRHSAACIQICGTESPTQSEKSECETPQHERECRAASSDTPLLRRSAGVEVSRIFTAILHGLSQVVTTYHENSLPKSMVKNREFS